MDTVLLAVAVVLLGLILVSLWVVLYQLVKQQGRLLLRLDGVERRLGIETPVALAPHDHPAGLAVGTAVDPFSLPDLDGTVVSLAELRGRQVVLVHWDAACGFCELAAPDLARLHDELGARGTELVLVSSGAAEPNRQLAARHGLRCPILLQADANGIPAFRGLGTPVAYLLDEGGKVAAPLAVGAEQVPALARDAVGGGRPRRPRRLRGERPLSESRIERGGLRAGTPAPTFRRPDVFGRPVALEDYRGRQLLLVFTDPGCGPCERLGPALVGLHQDGDGAGPAVLMVGRGDPGENRRAAEEGGLTFPVVVQERWELSREYGIFEAPVAFLVDEEGVIARDVVRGVDEILALAAAPPSGRLGRV